MIPLRSTLVIAGAGVLAGAGGVALAQDDESAKEPSAIVADASRDLAQVKSYHFAGTITDEDGRTKIAADVLASGDGRLSLSNKGEKAQLISVRGKSYIKANAAFWRDVSDKDTPKKVIARLSGRWIVQGDDEGDEALTSDFAPKRLAKCLRTGVGTLRKAGTGTVAGQAAVVLKDAGDKPGTAPTRYFFTTTAPILPLRIVQTGKAKAGKPKDASCGSADDTTTASDITLSRFGKVAKVTAPHGAVTPEQAVRGGSRGGGTTPA